MDYYETLGISKDASDEQVKNAFRTLSKKWHPDLQSGKSEAEKKEAEEKFKAINEAYATLSDKSKRAQYDQRGSDGPFFNGFGSFDDNFDPMSMYRHFGFDFGGRAHASKRRKPRIGVPENGSDVLANVLVTFKQSVFGTEKTLKCSLDEPCPHCHGTGAEGGKAAEAIECPHCHGEGTITHTVRNGFMVQMNTMPCPHCKGAGWKYDVCTHCHGSKRVSKHKEIKVKVPAGIADGMKLRIKRQGSCGICGGKDGDMYAAVKVQPSPVFKRLQTNDLLTTVSISPAIAALGGEIEFPGIDKARKIYVPAGTASGAKLDAGKIGLTDTAGIQHRIIVEVQIETPVGLDDNQKSFLKKLQTSFSSKNLPEAFKHRKEIEHYYSE